MSPANLQVMDFSEILNNASEQRLKYKELCTMLLNFETKAGEVVKCLTFLRDNIFLLDKEKEHFVGTLLNVNWIERNEEIQILYEEVILNLVSAHTCYLPSVLRMIVLKFYAGKNAVEKPFITSEDAEVFKKLHSLLKRIIKLVPLSPQVLMSMLATNYPYIRKCSYIHLCYVENILKISEYLPEERKNLLQLIVSNMLDIDVDSSGINTLVYHKPGSTSSYIPTGSCDPGAYKAAAFRALIRRAFTHSSNIQDRDTELAYILCVAAQHGYHKHIHRLIQHQQRIYSESAQESDQIEDGRLEEIKRIAITYNPYVKSIYAKLASKCQLRLAFRRCPTIFNLLRNGKDPPNPIRRPGIYSIPMKDNRCDRDLIYIGSTKRSMGVRIQEHLADIRHGRTSTALATGLKDILNIMTNWIHKYIDSQCENAQCITDTVIHGTFYTVCQTVFYVFVFHHKGLIETENVHLSRYLLYNLDIEDAELEENSMFPMEVDQEESEENIRMRHPLSNTLDILMERLFTFVDNVCKRKDSCLDWEATKKLYKEFLLLFERLILPTHACAHVQFVMFYICSFKQPLYEGFIDYLWKKVQNVNLPSVIRQACACYIGSFLARASYVSINGLKDILNIMTNWIHKYIDSQCENAQCITDTVIHGTFYTVCQTVFYVFVFHHKGLIETENGLKHVRKLNFERIVNCRLNPLKMCSPSVVANFANITKTYQIVYCYTIIERNNRSVLPVVAHTSGISQSINVMRLDIFFPFDPYILKISGERIQNLYRIYKQPSEEENEMKDEEFVPESSPSSVTMSDSLSLGTATYLGSMILKDR
ncbi:RNA polymerase I-specific transcription initiation factor RRN3-like [Centruroides sculpturatus]|uniref:RNA polymerase I-specific transcription initiation factor RRN3-like n=1 Tax=Centruroides sculpturatus TaxID=218467 RepID=UPI000C6EA99A|nr:RNA polymerase I-specific transcription initiation factor RRN3-like [Centruroides sculpturatus]